MTGRVVRLSGDEVRELGWLDDLVTRKDRPRPGIAQSLVTKGNEVPHTLELCSSKTQVQKVARDTG